LEKQNEINAARWLCVNISTNPKVRTYDAFFRRVLPWVGVILLILSVFAGLRLYGAAVDREYGDTTPYALYGNAIIMQVIVVLGLLKAVEYSVNLLQDIASSLRKVTEVDY
jgi:hypothetical protein